MKVLVIIVTYNAMQWIERCLNSVQFSIVKADAFVVDNGSTDGTQEYIQKHFSEVLLHQSKENLGFGRANNLGLLYALEHDYDYVYLLNQDAWIFPETIGRLIEVSANHPDYGILSPFQMNADVYHIDNNFLIDTCLHAKKNEIVNDIYNQKYKAVYEVPYVMAAHWFVSSKVIKEVGGFSPTFPHYGEDCNYIDRLQFKGFKTGVIPSLRVVHDRGERLDSNQKKMYIGYTGSLQLLSNPNIESGKAWKGLITIMLRNTYYYKSLKPVSYFFRILREQKRINNNKKMSVTNRCAFLLEK